MGRHRKSGDRARRHRAPSCSVPASPPLVSARVRHQNGNRDCPPMTPCSSSIRGVNARAGLPPWWRKTSAHLKQGGTTCVIACLWSRPLHSPYPFRRRSPWRGVPAPASAASSITCKGLAGTATGTVTVSKCTPKSKTNKSASGAAASLLSGGTITWTPSKQTTVTKLTVTSPGQGGCKKGSAEEDAKGSATGGTSTYTHKVTWCRFGPASPPAPASSAWSRSAAHSCNTRYDPFGDLSGPLPAAVAGRSLQVDREPRQCPALQQRAGHCRVPAPSIGLPCVCRVCTIAMADLHSAITSHAEAGGTT